LQEVELVGFDLGLFSKGEHHIFSLDLFKGVLAKSVDVSLAQQLLEMLVLVVFNQVEESGNDIFGLFKISLDAQVVVSCNLFIFFLR
jgi:hypothetical protein